MTTTLTLFHGIPRKCKKKRKEGKKNDTNFGNVGKKKKNRIYLIIKKG